MDSENNTTELLQNDEALSPADAPALTLSSVSFADGDDGKCVRFVLERNTAIPLTSFTVKYRFAGTLGGAVRESRFFSLCYDREGINTKDTIPIRMKVPDGYNAVECTAYVSDVVYADGQTDENGFDPASAVACRLENIDYTTGKKKLPAGVKALIITLCSLVVIGGAVFGGITLSKYLSVKSIVSSLVDDGRYAEAYRIAGECGGLTLERTVGGNIITKCLSERDFKTAYIYSSLIGREDTVFKRVEYEFSTSGESALTSDTFAVLKKIKNDEEFDRTVEEYINGMCDAGNYPAAMTACAELRSETEYRRVRRELVVNGVCYYAATSKLSGMAKYDRALEYLYYYSADADSTVAEEIVRRSLDGGDCAGAVVLSSYFGGMYENFPISPASIKITPHNKSISLSLDYAYPLLTDEQKRAYHADTFALSEEAFIIRGGTIAGYDIKNAVSVSTYENRTAVLTSDGKVTHLSGGGHNTTSAVPDGVNGVKVAVGLSHTVILNADGTVTAVGDNSRGQCGTQDWTDIVDIAAGRYFTLGLASDGTLRACGSSKCGVITLRGFSNVTAVAACDQTAVLLFSDGTVEIRGESSMGLRDANRFSGVAEIKAGGNAIIVKYDDGTFGIADGSIGKRSGSVDSWDASEVTAFAAGSQCIGYVDKSGRINIMGDGAPNT